MVSFGMNKVSFGLNKVSFGLNKVSFGINKVSFGLNKVSFGTNTDYSQWEYDCAVVRLVVTSMMYVQFMYNVRGYLSTLPLALKSEGAKRQIMPFHKQKAF